MWRGYTDDVCGGVHAGGTQWGINRGYMEAVCRGGMQRGYVEGYMEGVHRGVHGGVHRGDMQRGMQRG